MFFINYSKDILYLVLAFCVLWLTFFLAWLFYYLIASARQIHKVVQLIKNEVEQISSVIHKIKSAIEVPSSIIVLAIEGFKKIAEMGIEVFKENRANSRVKKTKNSEDKGKNDDSNGPIF